MIFRKAAPCLPVEVAHPTAPSLFLRTFSRKKPELGSFFGHSWTSTTSPTFSFGAAGSFSSSLPSISKASVRLVSFITLNWRPPSFRKTVPALPTAETHPTTSSFNAWTQWRMTPVTLSFMGPLMTLTISSKSRRRVVLLVLMPKPSVRAVCLTTYIYWGITCLNVSIDKNASPSWHSVAKTSERSSAASSIVSASSLPSASLPSFSSFSPSWSPSSVSSVFRGLITLSAVSKNARKSFSLIAPVPLASKRPKRSSSDRLRICWAYLATLSAAARTLSTSPARFLPTSSWKRAIRFVALLMRPSIRPSLDSCFFVSFEM
mmetsp:Transcript_98712/g.274666  ORF Transcript_98712/g.274666 Transcript_98712/m.274666 type:complete len:319 (-) Transcript_98712:2227-3183(-)